MAVRNKRLAKPLQRVMQPPARRAAERADARAFLIEAIDEGERSFAVDRGGEGGIVGEAEVVAKPDKGRGGGRGGACGHVA